MLSKLCGAQNGLKVSRFVLPQNGETSQCSFLQSEQLQTDSPIAQDQDAATAVGNTHCTEFLTFW